jgi:phosphatidylserine decarboxylase
LVSCAGRYLSTKQEFPVHMVKEAYKFAVPPLVAGGACFLLGWKVAGAVLVFLGAFIFYFFRDPERAIPQSPGLVVSPADGKIVEIVDEEFDGRAGWRISIFLSIWNVHVQRAPVAGRIANVMYRPGRFYGAYRAAASRENEQNVIYIDSQHGQLVFKQIAGAIARRVLCWKQAGQAVALGERVGLIRFGSRVDLWLPIGAEITVRRGQMVKGGESILAKWTSTV